MFALPLLKLDAFHAIRHHSLAIPHFGQLPAIHVRCAGACQDEREQAEEDFLRPTHANFLPSVSSVKTPSVKWP